MDTKTRIYYDFMIPPTYIRLISERLALDHIVYTDATADPIGYPGSVQTCRHRSL